MRQSLHAAELGFRHPITDEPLRFEMPMPADMVNRQAICHLRHMPLAAPTGCAYAWEVETDFTGGSGQVVHLT